MSLILIGRRHGGRGKRVDIRRRGRVYMTRNECETYLHTIRRSGLGRLPASVHVMPKNPFSCFFLGWAELVLLRTLNNCIGERPSRTADERFELTWARISRRDSASGGSKAVPDPRNVVVMAFISGVAVRLTFVFQSSAHPRSSNNFQQLPTTTSEPLPVQRSSGKKIP